MAFVTNMRYGIGGKEGLVGGIGWEGRSETELLRKPLLPIYHLAAGIKYHETHVLVLKPPLPAVIVCNLK